MRSVRSRRRGLFDVGAVGIGDWIILFSSLMTVISLFMPWFVNGAAHRSEWAFTYSEAASVVVIVFFLAVLFLVLYPAISPDAGLPPLPFATPVIFFSLGAILLLMFFYELGKYSCVLCSGTSFGFGIVLGLIASFIFMVGAVIKWGSRPSRGRVGLEH